MSLHWAFKWPIYPSPAAIWIFVPPLNSLGFVNLCEDAKPTGGVTVALFETSVCLNWLFMVVPTTAKTNCMLSFNKGRSGEEAP